MEWKNNWVTSVQTARKFKIKNKYANYWPIREALKARLKYTADWEKKKEARKIGAELKEVRSIFNVDDITPYLEFSS